MKINHDLLSRYQAPHSRGFLFVGGWLDLSVMQLLSIITNKDADGIWLDMTKEELTLACGKPDKKGNKSVSRTKVTEVWKFFGRINRQSTTSYKWEVRLENDIVEGWKELE